MTKGAAASPVDYQAIPAGLYGLTASAPAGFHLVGDNCVAGSKSTGSATVPLQGKGEVDFFVARDSGSLVGHIYDCTSGTADTTHDIVGNGTIAVGGGVSKPAAGNPIRYDVPTGSYTETATAPTGYHFVTSACQAPGSNTADVVVTTETPGEAIFYVALDMGDIAGNIFDCTSGTAGTINITGGKLSATGPSPVAQQGNPLAATVVPAGTYSMNAVAPAGYHLVNATCQAAPDTDAASVVVPLNGHGVGNFYVSRDNGSLAGHIYDCSTGSKSTTEVSGGTLGATGAGTVASAANPMPATVVPTGGYAVTGTTASGYHFVACEGSPGGNSAGANVVVDQTAVAILYVAKDAPPVVTGGHDPVSTTVVGAVSAVAGAATAVNPFTGRDDLARLAMVSLALMVLGVALLFATTNRSRRASS